MSLIFVDEQLPQDTFTYLCPAKDSTSWLDHVFASKAAAQSISDIYVDYESSIFDHFPLCFEYAFNAELVHVKKGPQLEKMVNWTRVNERDKLLITSKIDNMVKQRDCIEDELFCCSCVNCKDPKHLELIEKVFDFLKTVLFSSADNNCFSNMNAFKIIPGWNEYVKDFYVNARKKFLEWKRKGKPLAGIYRDVMRSARTLYINALDFC